VLPAVAVVGALLLVLALIGMFLLLPISALEAVGLVAVAGVGCVAILVWAFSDRPR
jgi:hypothetical protein